MSTPHQGYGLRDDPNEINGNGDNSYPRPYDYAPHQPYMPEQSETRSAPPVGPPPTYYRVLNKRFPHSLRPILLFSCFISFCYLILLGIQDFKTSGQSGVSGKYKLFTIIQGILFMAAAGIEVFGLVSTYTQKLVFARLYSFLSLIGFAAVVASQVIGVIVIFAFKSEVISSCTSYYTGAQNVDNPGWFWSDNNNNTPMSAADANTYCSTLWSRSRTWEIIWLIVTALIGAIFCLFAFAYARQLSDPNSVRSKLPASSQYGQQQQYGNWQGGSGMPYDPEAQHRYPPPPMQPNTYAPPTGAPPPPEYKMRPSMDDVDFDAKTPAGEEYGYGYGLGQQQQQQRYSYENEVPRANRPGSSRSVRREVDEDEDEDKRRDSGETLRGDTKSEKTQTLAKHEEDHDNTPRI